VLAIHSTVHPETCVRLAEQAAGRGVAVIDAPVSGGGLMAAARRLLVMVGGEDETVNRCRPVFETFGDPVIHLGPLGSGQMTKLLNNLVFTAQLTLAIETFTFADQLGVDRQAMAQVLANGSGGSRAVAILAASGVNLTGISQSRGLLEKDVSLMLEVASAKEAAEPDAIAMLARRSLATLATLATTPDPPPAP
jgi:3-hydroxyisobutyrate dehydrogenase